MSVLSTISGSTERVGDSFNRCMDIDDIITATSDDDVFTDTRSSGGNGNTYRLVCGDPITATEVATSATLVGTIMAFLFCQQASS